MASHRPTAQGQQDGDEKRCSHCGTTHSSTNWKRHPATGQLLCNACGKYADEHGDQLPPDSVLQRRPAEPRRKGTKAERAQRRCLQCGSASPGGGKRPQWNRHPSTGEEWLCGPCFCRIYDELKGGRKDRWRKPQQAAAGSDSDLEEQQQGQSRRQQHPGSHSEEAGLEEGEQAPAPQPRLRAKRTWQQEQQGEGDEAPGTFHGGPASAAKRRARGNCGTAPEQQLRQKAEQHGKPPAASSGGTFEAPKPAAKRRQRRKQAQPQHLPAPLPQGAGELSLAPTEVVEAAVEEAGSQQPAAASMHATAVVAGSTQGAVGAAAATASHADQPPAPQQAHQAVEQQAQQAAAQQAAAWRVAAQQAEQQPQVLLPQPAAEQDLFDLLEQAMEVAAAAASGLTPELVAAFAMLPPLEARRETLLRRLLQRHQYSAAAAAMQVALRAAGHPPPVAG